MYLIRVIRILMKILIVCSYRDYTPHTNFVAPFIYEQVQSLEKSGCNVHYLFVKGGGFSAYILGSLKLIKTVKKIKPDIVHAHGGLCGFISNIQRMVPVVTTYHGSDINKRINRFISQFSIHFSAYNIFVSQKLIELSKPTKNFSLIPCGVDLDKFYPINDKKACREKLHLEIEKKIVLFSKMFYDPVKNYPLAKQAIEQLNNVELIQFIGYTRDESCLLMNACDAVLMTSFTEGSPQFIKEAMACNCPIVSVDVGDVKDVIQGTTGCYITSYDPDNVSLNLQYAIDFASKTNGRSRITDFDNKKIAEKIINIYNLVIRSKVLKLK